MEWSEAAKKKAKAVLRVHAEDLEAEATRVAQRTEAGAVGPAYVEQAARTLNLRRSNSPLGDVLLAIGPASAGIGSGVGVAFVTSDDLILDGWVSVGSIVIALVGMLFTGAGIALKLGR